MNVRQKLLHSPPSFVPAGSLFFITVCAMPRGKNQLAHTLGWQTLMSAAMHYHALHRWHPRLLHAMPDHVHLLVSFPAHERLDRVFSAWKHYTHRNAHMNWQRDFFDRRLRDGDNVDEKTAYILMNPVRAGLVSRPEEWPYVWVPPDIVATPK